MEKHQVSMKSSDCNRCIFRTQCIKTGNIDKRRKICSEAVEVKVVVKKKGTK